MRVINRHNAGLTLVEVSLSVAIFVTIAIGVAVPIIGNHLSRFQDLRSTAALAMLDETYEALRSIRDNDWSDLIIGTHGLRQQSGHWELFGSSDEYDGFTRTVTLSSVQRDLAGDIVESGGQNDSDTLEIEIEVTWPDGTAQSRSLLVETILTNYANATAWP